MSAARNEIKVPFARRIDGISGSPIRDLLSQAGKEGFISLGGGYPDPKSFPVETIKALREKVESTYGSGIYQYARTEGFPHLLETLPLFLNRQNRRVIAEPGNIIVTHGSQQALSILAMALVNEGDKIAVESPTYLGATQAFNAFGPQYIEIESDRDGIIPESLEEAFRKHPDIRFLYTVPTFQNPTGRVIPRARREKIAAILQESGKLAIEDDPYSEIRYEGGHVPSLKALAPENVIHLFTFSKTLAPDFRIGGMVAPTAIREKAAMVKQGIDLCDSQYNQALLAEYISGGHIDEHIPNIVRLYRPKRNAMVEAIKESFPNVFDLVQPEGGMFLWVSLKKDSSDLGPRLDVRDVLRQSIEQNVGFVPGIAFYANGAGPFSMRLNFTNQTEENIKRGVGVIGDILRSRLK